MIQHIMGWIFGRACLDARAYGHALPSHNQSNGRQTPILLFSPSWESKGQDRPWELIVKPNVPLSANIPALPVLGISPLIGHPRLPVLEGTMSGGALQTTT